MKQVFVSYHYTTMDAKYNGFGNYVGKFNTELYAGDLSKFILHLEKAIAMQLESQLNMPCQIKVMFFR